MTTTTTATTTATGQDAEELLQRILYSDLARLIDPPFPTLPRGVADTEVAAMTMPSSPTIRKASSFGDDDDNDHAVSEIIWQYLVCSAEERMDDERMTTTTTTTTTTLDEWKKGWKQIGSILSASSNLLSPFCIHDTATQALFLKESGDLDEENNNTNVNSKKATASSSSFSSSSCRLFTTTCFLVCCAALQRCPAAAAAAANNNNTDADTVTPPPPPPPLLSRKRRWRSCMMNTVRLVQQQWLQQQQQQQQQQLKHFSNHDKKNSFIVSVFVHYVVPTCLQVQQTLFHDDENNIIRNDAWFWQAAIHAGLIATISSMAAAAVTNLTNNDNDADNKLLELLVKTLDRILMTGGGNSSGGGDVHAVVWKHPWRKRHRLGPQELLRADESTTTSIQNHNNSHQQSAQTLSYEDSLCYWTAPVLSSDEEEVDDWDDDDDDDLQPQSRGYHRSESVACMNTIWNNVGIAVLANYNLCIDEHRPLVYTNQYIWQVGFPHVAALLLTTTENVNDCSSMMIDVHYRQNLVCQQDKQQILGYNLLEWLLSRMPEEELSKPVMSVHEPLSPIPVFQLLSNRIIDTGRAAVATTATTTVVVLPSGYQAYQLMKLLLSKYKLAHQLDLVRKLYTDCPHSGLGPKILDLLRGLLLTLAKGNIEVDSPSNDLLAAPTRQLAALWDYLDTLLCDLDGHVECLNNELMSIKTTTYQDDKSSSCQSSLFLIDSVQEFVADAEKFVSVLTLLRTWMLVKNNAIHNNKNNNIPDIPQLASRLEAAHKALEIMFEHANEKNDSVKDAESRATTTTATSVRPPEQQLFRLQLLMQALEESIQLLQKYE